MGQEQDQTRYCSPTSGRGYWEAASARSNTCSRVRKRFSALGNLGSFIPAAGFRAIRPSRTASSKIRYRTRLMCQTKLADSLIEEIRAGTSAWLILLSGVVPSGG